LLPETIVLGRREGDSIKKPIREKKEDSKKKAELQKLRTHHETTHEAKEKESPYLEMGNG